MRMTTGRPKASSRDTLAEAACELFLEQGYAHTSVEDIARRAGVSRSSFFNYFASKSDVLWAGLDERIVALEGALASDDDLARHLRDLGAGFAPDSLALAMVHREAMGIGDELDRESAWRHARISATIAASLRRRGVSALRADVVAAAHAGAVMAAVAEWARRGAGSSSLPAILSDALDEAAATLPLPVRELRVVARADDFERSLAFYRDVLGMPQQAAFQGEGGARVAILWAGRATLELANAEQIDLIDRVETDGDAPSERVRIGLRVDDTAASTVAMTDAGAILEASPRVTPWRSVNSRLRAPAGLQVTLFQEPVVDA